jgi:exopolysaccharide biosynthesis polyprenyl glycosylphosphotransferase
MTEALLDAHQTSARPLAPALPVPAARSRRAPVDRRLLLDCTAVAAAVAVTRVVPPVGKTPSLFWPALFGLLVLLRLAIRRAYARRLRADTVDDLRLVAQATVTAGVVTAALQLALSPDEASAGWIAALAGYSAVYLAGGRAGLRFGGARGARRPEESRSVLIVGAGSVGCALAMRLPTLSNGALRPVGFLDDDPLVAADASMPVLGTCEDLEDVARRHGIGHVVLAFSSASAEELLGVVHRCDRLGLTVSYVPHLFEALTGRLTVEHLGGIAVVTREPIDPRGRKLQLKYGVERLIAVAVLVLLLPLLGLLALGVRLSVGRPVFFRQTRIGLDGRPFEMLKFRSMRDGGHRSTSATLDVAPGGIEGDDRRTPLGILLRRTSLDELPQLLNVVRGDMSLVGPRPERPEFVELFERSIYRYGDRHRVKVGMTGWAQVHGLRGKTSLSDRVEWDNYYISNWSLWLDLKVLLLTVLAVAHSPRHVE